MTQNTPLGSTETSTLVERPPLGSTVSEGEKILTPEERDLFFSVSPLQFVSVAAPPTDGSYELQKLRQNHRDILRLYYLGWKQKEIAAHLGVTLAKVGYTLASPLVQAELARLNGEADAEAVDVKEMITAVAPSAFATIESVMNSPLSPAAVRLRAATDLLDRSQGKSPTIIKGNIEHKHLSTDTIKGLKARGKELLSLGASGLVVPDEDASFTETSKNEINKEEQKEA